MSEEHKDQQPSSEKEYSNSEFIKVQRLAAQLAIDAYEEDQEWCPTKTARLLDACDRLYTSEQQRKDLLDACVKVNEWLQNNVFVTNRPAWLDDLLIEAIAKAEKEG